MTLNETKRVVIVILAVTSIIIIGLALVANHYNAEIAKIRIAAFNSFYKVYTETAIKACRATLQESRPIISKEAFGKFDHLINNDWDGLVITYARQTATFHDLQYNNIHQKFMIDIYLEIMNEVERQQPWNTQKSIKEILDKDPRVMFLLGLREEISAMEAYKKSFLDNYYEHPENLPEIMKNIGNAQSRISLIVDFQETTKVAKQ